MTFIRVSFLMLSILSPPVITKTATINRNNSIKPKLTCPSSKVSLRKEAFQDKTEVLVLQDPILEI